MLGMIFLYFEDCISSYFHVAVETSDTIMIPDLCTWSVPSLEACKIFTLFLAFLNFCDVPLHASVFIHYAGPLAGPLSPWNSSLIAGSPLDLFHWWLLFSQFFLEAPLIGHWNSVLVLCTYFLSLSLFKIAFNFYSNYLQMSSTLYQKPSISFSFFLYWFIGAFIYSLSVHFSK